MGRFALLSAGSLAAAALVALGCGEHIDLGAEREPVEPGAGGGASSSSSSSGGGGGYAPLSGSYDLTFTHVVGSPGPLGVPSPSEGRQARVDLRLRGGEYEAIVTPRWGSPTSAAVNVTDAAVLVAGSIPVVDAAAPSRTDSWTVLRIPRRADGKLIGSISADGEATETEGDKVTSFPIKSAGSIGRDITAPALRSTPSSALGPSQQLLPWDAVLIDAAEGVGSARLIKATSLYRLDGAAQWVPGPAAFTTEPVDPSVAWGGVVHAWGRVTSWDEWMGSIAQLVVAAGVADPAGNKADSLNALFPFAFLPPPAAWHGFDSDLSEVASWGDLTWLGGKTGPTAMCEQGGCVELGPFEPAGCAPERIGVAGRLQLLSAISSVSARVRVLAADVPPRLVALTVEVAVPGEPPVRVPVAPTAFVDLGPYAGPLHWATPWMWVTVPVVADGSIHEVGYDVVAGAPDAPSCGTPTPPLAPIAVLIDRVVGPAAMSSEGP